MPKGHGENEERDHFSVQISLFHGRPVKSKHIGRMNESCCYFSGHFL